MPAAVPEGCTGESGSGLADAIDGGNHDHSQDNGKGRPAGTAPGGTATLSTNTTAVARATRRTARVIPVDLLVLVRPMAGLPGRN
ncbi:hypothetical protein Pme01_28800 [Planosporangium mesophilum]|uniref:Uncharacterized protein n=1 Tax=Planosporangium mesophilum TaxID=689768 RepID=A0A8J3X3X2_9ACTN|nr:hypothetical protein Pme01_28800 [Planosporangium mesophilum]